MNATERAIPIASKVNVSLSIITIPSGKDPDELIKQDPEIWKQIIGKPQYALDWLMERYQKQLDITSAQGKRTFSDVTLTVIRALRDQVEQDHYLQEVSKLIGVSHDALLAKMQNKTTEKPRLKTPKNPPRMPDKATADHLKTQNHLLSLVLMQPKLRPLVSIMTADMLPGEDARAVCTFLQEHPDFAGDPATATSLRPVSDYVKMIALLFETVYQDIEPAELQFEVIRLRGKLIEQYVKMQKPFLDQAINNALASGDKEQQQALHAKIIALNNLRNTHKKGV